MQTQATTVSSVVRVDQIQNLPLITRNSLNFVVFLPGVDTSSANHSQRSSTIAGLPQSSISLTVDGANIQDKYTRSTDGFFANIHPKLDLIEEVTVSSATATADSSGQGAVQIKFVTRSGTNTFNGSGYEYARHRALNTNYYFNIRAGLPKNQLTLNQWGFREGGPIVLPGLRRPRQGVLLLQLRTAAVPAEQHPHARDPHRRTPSRASSGIPAPARSR